MFVLPSLKPYRSNKLESKTTEYIFLGYVAQYKRFIYFSLKDNKLLVSRHVVFDEGKLINFVSSLHQRTTPESNSSQLIHLSHPNTFTHQSIIPIPFPYVSPLSSSGVPITSKVVAQSCPPQQFISGDLVPPQAVAKYLDYMLI